MKENLRTSLDKALKFKKMLMVVNHYLTKMLRENPDLSDELQILFGEASSITVQEYEATVQLIEFLTERLNMLGEEGLEKCCRYKEGDEE